MLWVYLRLMILAQHKMPSPGTITNSYFYYYRTRSESYTVTCTIVSHRPAARGTQSHTHRSSRVPRKDAKTAFKHPTGTQFTRIDDTQRHQWTVPDPGEPGSSRTLVRSSRTSAETAFILKRHPANTSQNQRLETWYQRPTTRSECRVEVHI